MLRNLNGKKDSYEQVCCIFLFTTCFFLKFNKIVIMKNHLRNVGRKSCLKNLKIESHVLNWTSLGFRKKVLKNA